jgi:predicted Zn-dependent protease
MGKEAEQILLSLQKKYPKNVLIANQLSWLYIETLSTPEKAASLIAILESEAEEPTVMDTIGWYYYKIGNFRYAVYYLNKATTMEPENRDIRSHFDAAFQKTNPSK